MYTKMSEVYYLLAATSYGIFIVQFVLSWFGGDTDLDVDLDGEIDMNVGDIVSFKGFIHFLMGGCGWLSIRCFKHGNVEWYDYLIALALGVIFVVILYYLYKPCLKLQHSCIPEKGERLVGKAATIYLPGDSYYLLTLEINGISEEISAYPESSNMAYKQGTDVIITRYEGGKYYFN